MNKPTTKRTLREMTFYWPLTLKRNYFVSWLLVGTCAFLGIEAILGLTGEPHYLWTELFFTYFMVAGIPILCLRAAEIYQGLPELLTPILTTKATDLDDWITVQGYRIFGAGSRLVWPVVLAVDLLGSITLLTDRIPYQSVTINLLGLVIMQVIFFLAGHGAYLLAGILILYYRVVRLPLSSSLS